MIRQSVARRTHRSVSRVVKFEMAFGKLRSKQFLTEMEMQSHSLTARHKAVSHIGECKAKGKKVQEGRLLQNDGSHQKDQSHHFDDQSVNDQPFRARKSRENAAHPYPHNDHR